MARGKKFDSDSGGVKTPYFLFDPGPGGVKTPLIIVNPGPGGVMAGPTMTPAGLMMIDE